MNWCNKTLKYLTVLIVVMLVLSPETAQLGLFIDAAGLDLLIILFEIQLLAIATTVYQRLIQSIGVFLKRSSPHSPGRLRNRLAGLPLSLALTFPAEATFMHLLVGGVVICMTYPALLPSQLFAV